MSFSSLLTELAVISRRDGSLNDLGEEVGTFSTVATVPASIQREVSSTGILVGGEDDRPLWRMWCPIETDLRRDDRVLTCGIRFRVSSTPADAASRAHHLEAILWEVPDDC